MAHKQLRFRTDAKQLRLVLVFEPDRAAAHGDQRSRARAHRGCSVTVTPETRLLDVHRLFVEEEIHGAPRTMLEHHVHRVPAIEPHPGLMRHTGYSR